MNGLTHEQTIALANALRRTRDARSASAQKATSALRVAYESQSGALQLALAYLYDASAGLYGEPYPTNPKEPR